MHVDDWLAGLRAGKYAAGSTALGAAAASISLVGCAVIGDAIGATTGCSG